MHVHPLTLPSLHTISFTSLVRIDKLFCTRHSLVQWVWTSLIAALCIFQSLHCTVNMHMVHNLTQVLALQLNVQLCNAQSTTWRQIFDAHNVHSFCRLPGMKCYTQHVKIVSMKCLMLPISENSVSRKFDNPVIFCTNCRLTLIILIIITHYNSTKMNKQHTK